MSEAPGHTSKVSPLVSVLPLPHSPARRIDLPADWMVSVSPAQVSLAPGEQTTVTVTVAPGSLVPQNSMPRVAVEGYVGNQLLGGVAIDIVVPRYVPFAPYHVHSPLVRR